MNTGISGLRHLRGDAVRHSIYYDIWPQALRREGDGRPLGEYAARIAHENIIICAWPSER